MALNPDAVGKSTKPLIHRCDDRSTILYALGVGATGRDDIEFLYEGFGPKVLPTYATVPFFDTFPELFALVGGDFAGVVHGAQSTRWFRPIRVNETFTVQGDVEGLYDLKRLATGTFAATIRAEDGEPVAELKAEIVFRNDGGFGGERPPHRERVTMPERAPDFVRREPIGDDQALLFRLSGDRNPLHADVELAKRVGFHAPILHGLCTYGYIGRAVLSERCDNDPGRLKALSGKFTKPVWPGETLIIEGFDVDDRVLLRVTTEERPQEVCFAEAWAEILR
ncbi:MAG: MaoC/PaaZ C-terminal domain-containing protein [Polyangiales bacterium]